MTEMGCSSHLAGLEMRNFDKQGKKRLHFFSASIAKVDLLCPGLSVVVNPHLQVHQFPGKPARQTAG